jgi:hypothetical protein
MSIKEGRPGEESGCASSSVRSSGQTFAFSRPLFGKNFLMKVNILLKQHLF